MYESRKIHKKQLERSSLERSSLSRLVTGPSIRSRPALDMPEWILKWRVTLAIFISMWPSKAVRIQRLEGTDGQLNETNRLPTTEHPRPLWTFAALIRISKSADQRPPSPCPVCRAGVHQCSAPRGKSPCLTFPPRDGGNVPRAVANGWAPDHWTLRCSAELIKIAVVGDGARLAGHLAGQQGRA